MLVLGRMKRFLVYVVAFHLARVFSELIFPNAYVFNRLRGTILGSFFAERGAGLALANGVVANGLWNLRVGSDVYLAHRCWINAVAGLTIGDGAIISPNVVIATTAHRRINGSVSLRQSNQSPIIIGRGVWIASNSVITKGSVIGEGAIIAAGSVVYGEVPPRTLYRGNPAVWVKDLRD